MNYSQSQSEANSNGGKPNPSDFAAYLPWACHEMEIEENVVVVKIIQSDSNFGSSADQKKTRSQRAKYSQSVTKTEADYGLDKDESSGMTPMIHSSARCVIIWAIYDKYNNLVQIDFDKRSSIPRNVLKIFCLLLPFQNYLQNITIKGGIDKYTMPEIANVLTSTNITDICLDNVFLPEANFYLLLDTTSSLRNLSLARCKINDPALKMIADRLVYPMPASKSLTFLNLSSNVITDIGAQYLGDVLRSNRQLYYLNLAGNMLSDDGAGSILDSLLEFPLTYEEITSKRSRHIEFLKQRDALIQQTMKDLIAEEEKRMKTRAPSMVSDKKIKVPKQDNFVKVSDSDKAIALVERVLGVFKDPFHVNNIVVKDEVLYSCGNNVLCYLNLAFNNVGFVTVEKLLAVLKFQRLLERKPRGLLKVSLEGNPLPNECKEMKELDCLFEAALYNSSKKMPAQTAKRKSVKNL